MESSEPNSFEVTPATTISSPRAWTSQAFWRLRTISLLVLILAIHLSCNCNVVGRCPHEPRLIKALTQSELLPSTSRVGSTRSGWMRSLRPTGGPSLETTNISKRIDNRSRFLLPSETISRAFHTSNRPRASLRSWPNRRRAMTLSSRRNAEPFSVRPSVRLASPEPNPDYEAQPLVAYSNSDEQDSPSDSSPRPSSTQLPSISSSTSTSSSSPINRSIISRSQRTVDQSFSSESIPAHFPLVIHQGDIFIAYVGCALPAISALDRASSGVQAAMSSVWAAHRYNQLVRTLFELPTSPNKGTVATDGSPTLASSTSTSSANVGGIKLGVYHFELCSPIDNRMSLVDKLNVSSIKSSSSSPPNVDDGDDLSYSAHSLPQVRFEQLTQHALKLFAQTPSQKSQSSSSSSPSSSSSLHPIVGIILDVDSLRDDRLKQFATLPVPVILSRPVASSGNLFPAVIGPDQQSLDPSLFRVSSSVDTLVQGLMQLVHRLQWRLIHLSFLTELPTLVASNETALLEQLSAEQRTFGRLFLRAALQNGRLRVRLTKFTGRSLVRTITLTNAINCDHS